MSHDSGVRKKESSNLGRRNNPALHCGPGLSEHEPSIQDQLGLIATITTRPMHERKTIITACLPQFLGIIYDDQFTEREKFVYSLESLDSSFCEHLSALFVDSISGLNIKRQKQLASLMYKRLKHLIEMD